MSLVSDAVLAAISDKLELELECGDVKLVRRRRQGVEVFIRGSSGKYGPKPRLVLDEIEAADLNNKLDELLRQ